jgi:hypothetical protein
MWELPLVTLMMSGNEGQDEKDGYTGEHMNRLIKWLPMLLLFTVLLTPLVFHGQAVQHGDQLSWNAVTTVVGGGALPAGTSITYIVYRSTTSGSGFVSITPTPIAATTYLDPAAGLTTGTVYYYTVAAVLTCGSSSTCTGQATSAQSSQVSVTFLAPAPVAAAPAGLTAVSQ